MHKAITQAAAWLYVEIFQGKKLHQFAWSIWDAEYQKEARMLGGHSSDREWERERRERERGA